jgi:hypothetical protein
MKPGPGAGFFVAYHPYEGFPLFVPLAGKNCWLRVVRRPVANDNLKIEVETRKVGNAHASPLDVVIRVDGKEVARGARCVPRHSPLRHAP